MPKTPIPETAPLECAKALKKNYSALIAIPCCNESSNLPEVI